MPPMNLVGDFGGGGMLLAFGVVCALLVGAAGGGRARSSTRRSWTASPRWLPAIHGLRNTGRWRDAARAATCSTAARRSTTRTSARTAGSSRSARWSRGSTPNWSRGPGRPTRTTAARLRSVTWPATRAAWAALFRTRTRDEWAALLEPTRTRASHRCWTGTRHPTTRTGRPGDVRRRTPAAAAGDRRRGSPARPPRCGGRHRIRASTPTSILEWARLGRDRGATRYRGGRVSRRLWPGGSARVPLSIVFRYAGSWNLPPSRRGRPFQDPRDQAPTARWR